VRGQGVRQGYRAGVYGPSVKVRPHAGGARRWGPALGKQGLRELCARYAGHKVLVKADAYVWWCGVSCAMVCPNGGQVQPVMAFRHPQFSSL